MIEAVWVFISFAVLSCSSISTHPLLLVISFDGFRYDYMSKETTPHLERLASSGAKAPYIQPRFISKTFPNHFSIVTGLYEESHGIVGNEFYDPELNDVFYMNKTDAKWWDKGGLPIWVLNQESGNDRFSGGAMWPGTNAFIHNQTAHYLLNFNRSISWESRVDTAVGWFTRKENPANVVFLYFEEPDSAGHEYGPYSPQVTAQVKRVDALVDYLIEKLRDEDLFDKVNIVITSDHGMTDVPNENVIKMREFLDLSTFKAYGGSPVWNIFPNPGKEDYVYKTLLEASHTKPFTVYKKEEIPEEYFYRNNDRIGPIVIAADEHWEIFYADEWNLTKGGIHGTHGYNNSLKSMQPLFLAHGPAFRIHSQVMPFANVDLYPLMCHVLLLGPAPNNGTLKGLRSLLRHPPGTDINGQLLHIVLVIFFASLVMGIVTLILTIRQRKSQLLNDELDAFPKTVMVTVPSDADFPTLTEEKQLLLSNIIQDGPNQ